MRAIILPAVPLLLPLLPLLPAPYLICASPICTTSSIDPPPPPPFGTSILNITAEPVTDWANITDNNVCYVTVTLTHPGTGDVVNNFFALPLSAPWNGIFQGIGGGGFAAGTITDGAPYTASGYVVGATDAGLRGSSQDASGWALLSPGNVDQNLLLNFAHRSPHDMTVLGKSVAAGFYGGGGGPRRSYWNGCSTGGRQGLALAQYYPSDYDGILADAPAVQWNDFTLAQQWPYTVQANEGYAPSPCELARAVEAAVAACDALDGLVDQIISAPALCEFSAQELVGTAYSCGGDDDDDDDDDNNNNATGTFTQQAADVVDKIWDGPRTPEGELLWYGLARGANFSRVAPNIAGNASAQPFTIVDSWVRGFIAKDLGFDTANVSYAEFADIFLQGHLQYDSILGSASPNLAPFRRRGGKLITWQGLADGSISPQGTQFYYQKMLALDPSAPDFYRQFYSPGVGHCGTGGTGVQPLDALGQLRAWVENGTAPDVLHAAGAYPVNASSSADAAVGGTGYARFLDLCPWPAVERYTGGGDPALASSWECATGTGWVEFAGLNAANYSYVGGPGWYGSSFPEVEI